MKKFERYSTPAMWIMAVLLGTALAGCDSGKEPVLGNGGDNAGLLPAVSATFPAATTPIVTGVASSANVTATFSKDMQAATINDSTFLLACPAATPVTGTVSYSATTRVATFNPTAALPFSTVCTATISMAATDTSGRALASDYVWRFSTVAAADTVRPTVLMHVPATNALGVATNTKITATFSEPMDPTTFSATSFTLAGPAMSPVTGMVSYSAGTRVATFTPTTPLVLAANTQYTATVTSAVTDLAGNELAGDVALLPAASNHVWTFTTAAGGDVIAPQVSTVNPANGSTSICLQKDVMATFDEPMNPTTLTGATFTVQRSGPPLGALLVGTVSYDVADDTATFNPNLPLTANTQYTATITTGARDTSGNALAAARVWSFTTGTQVCSPAAPIALGTAAPFGNVGGTAGTTNAGILTVINGDMSTTATVTSAVTGFHDTAGDIYTETGSNQGSVTGKIYSCTVSTLGPTSAAVNAASCSMAQQALADSQSAFNNLSPAVLPGGTDPGAGQLGGLTLAPGVYKAAGGSFMITGSDLTLDGQGDANAVFVFQTASTLDVGAPAAPRNIILINGAQAKNVFWHVGTSATINAAGGGTMVGTILASSAVSFSTVGNVALVTLNGRAVGLNASVTMTNTVINVPAP